jgi:hypothetical protein
MGITVSNIAVISPTSLTAHLAIAATAPAGNHDVKLTIGSNSVTGIGAFAVAAPLQVTGIMGRQAQGGVLTANIENIDHQAFDPTTVTFGPQVLLFPWTSQIGPTATNATVALLVDPLAPTGKSGIVATNAGGLTFESNADAVNVAAATPTALTGTQSGTVANAGDTAFYKYTSSGAEIVHSTFSTPTTSALNAFVAVYPTTGKSADMLGTGTTAGLFGPQPIPDTIYPVAAKSDTYFVVGDTGLTGGSDHTFSLGVTSTPVPAANVVKSSSTAHGTISTAQALSGLPAIITGGVMSTKTTPDLQLYSFTAAANDLYEVSFAGNADLGVFLCPKPTTGDIPDLNACNTLFAAVTNLMPGQQAANGTMTTAIATAGTYYVLVAGLYGGNYPKGNYTAAIRKTN